MLFGFAINSEPRHLLRVDRSALLKISEDGRELPSGYVDQSAAIPWQNPRNILEKPTAGDMRQTLDFASLNQRKKFTDVDSCGLEKDLCERAPAFARQGLVEVPAFLLDDPPHERKTVAVHARARQV